MAEESSCRRCGSARAVSAHLEHPLALCVDHASHHGVLHVGLRVILCQDCGHVEFEARDPAQLVRPRADAGATVLQEEDF